MISSIVSRLVILVFGTLYPAYASYKAVRTKNVKEYVKWMMYWIVFALFTCAETFTDVFLSFWFPFYYEIKIILVLWLLSPATKGSSILYRKFVHPMLSRREQEIDEYIAKAKEQGYHTVLHLGTKGVNYATTVLMQTAIKGGGGLVNQLRRSYSLSDLSSDKDSDMNRNKALKNVEDEDEMEETDGLDPRMLRPRGYSPRRSASGSGRVEMYFPEVDVDVRQHGNSRPREPSIPLSHIRSSEDVSSGYSSAEPLYAGHHATKSEGLAASREPLVRTASVGSTRSMRTKSSRGGVVAKRGPAAEDSDFFEQQGEDAVFNNKEDFVSDHVSSLSSQPTATIPLSMSVTAKRPITPLSSVPEIPTASNQNGETYPKLNDVTSTQDHFVDASDYKQESQDDGDEDLPLFDAETDESKNQSNEFSLSESLVSSVKHDVSSVSSIETPSSKDLTISASDIAANEIVPHPCTLSSEKSSINEPPITQSHTVNDTTLNSFSSVDKTNLSENAIQSSVHDKSHEEDKAIINETPVPKNEVPKENNAKKEELFNSSQAENQVKSISEPLQLNSSNNIDTPSEYAQSTITAPEINKESSEDTSIATISIASETLSESLPAVVTPPLSITSAESLMENSDSSTLNEENVLANKMTTDQKECENSNMKLSAEEAKLSPEDALSAYESVESLPMAESPSRSNSQTSLRKDSRAGRYHKLPAPTPPKTPEIDRENTTDHNVSTDEEIRSTPATPSLEKKEFSEDTATGSDDSEAAVTTARLVLKPGVVRSVGPDANTKAEVFVSKAPPAKSKKSKSKHKQKESSLSRFFALPKNQFGSLTSLLPFWHGKQEPSTSEPAISDTSSAFQSTSGSAFVPVDGSGSSGSVMQDERNNLKSLNHDSIDVKEMSHSPGQQRRAPLANCE